MPVSMLAWIGPMLIAAAAGAAVAAITRLGTPFRIAAASLAAFGAIVPLGPHAFAPLLLSLIGPPSAALIVLLIALVGSIVLPGRDTRPSIAFLVGVVASGLLLYPATLGLAAFDPYDLGYRGLAVPGLMVLLVVAGWLARARDLPCWIALAALLHAFAIHGSGNLWNDLIDPLAVLLAAAWLVTECVRCRRGLVRSAS